MNKTPYVLLFFLMCGCCAFAIQDDFVNTSLADKNLECPYYQEKYNYNDTTLIPVKLAIKNKVKSENDIYEGQELEFRVVENVVYNNKILVHSGTLATARVETIIANGMNGIPASVILGDFKVNGLESHKLTMEYEKYGVDLSLFVFPLKWLLTPLPPTGSLTNFIKGGHVKFKENEEILIYYHPNWL